MTLQHINVITKNNKWNRRLNNANKERNEPTTTWNREKTVNRGKLRRRAGERPGSDLDKYRGAVVCVAVPRINLSQHGHAFDTNYPVRGTRDTCTRQTGTPVMPDFPISRKGYREPTSFALSLWFIAGYHENWQPPIHRANVLRHTLLSICSRGRTDENPRFISAGEIFFSARRN